MIDIAESEHRLHTTYSRDNEAQARATAYIPVLWSEEIILEALGTPQRITITKLSYCIDISNTISLYEQGGGRR